MAKATSNPCGLSYDHIVDIIKNKVMGGKYNSRQEVMDALVTDGFSYDEAKAVADFYYKIYNRLATNKKEKVPITLTGKQRTDRKIKNLAIDYLNGSVGAFQMSDQDFEHLEKIYEKQAAADTPTLKAKYDDEAAVFVQKFMPGYTDELFRSFVYAKPLLSGIFFIKSLTSNLYGQFERSFFNSIWDGKKIDYKGLNKFNDLANASALHVLEGGIPAASLYQAESGFDPTRGRVEEYSIQGTAADANKKKATYYKLINFLSKWSNRFNAMPDTRGIFHNAERHFYQLSKEYYRNEGYSDADATAKALQDMELDDINSAKMMAEAKFKELGLEAYDKNDKPTNEFKVTVAEYQRRGREENRWKKALQLSKNDFWKKNMMLPTELGFGDYGLFGLKAQLLVRFRDYIEKRTKNKLASAFNLSAFGFINGAANFAEDALERVPPYAAVKLAFLQHKKGNVTDGELQNDIMRRQKDIIAKNLVTTSFFLFSRMIENLICGDKSGRETSSQISEGRTQIGPCGIPVIVPPQMLATYKWYRIIDAAVDNDEEFFGTVLNMLPVLVQANNVGLGGAADKFGTAVTNYVTASAAGDQVRAGEEKQKMVNVAVDYGIGVGNTFLPIPSRLGSELGVTAQRIQGQTQRQQPLPFAIDAAGNPKGAIDNFGKVAIASLGNVTGINDMVTAAIGSDRPYALDWLGRKVVQFRGSDITGSGIKYEAADDILAEAGVKPPYIYRLQKVKGEDDSEKSKSRFLGIDVNEISTKQRYLTDREYFMASEALGNFNKEFFRDNQDDLIGMVNENKDFARKFIESVFQSTKRVAIEAIEKGIDNSDDIQAYINKKWKSGRGMTMTQKSVE